VRWVRAKKSRQWRKMRRRCELCSATFTPNRKKAKFCSPSCQRLAGTFARSERRSSGPEERIATRDREHMLRIIRTARGRGCRKVLPNQASALVEGPFYSAWHRGGGLFAIRVRWPEGEEDAADG